MSKKLSLVMIPVVLLFVLGSFILFSFPLGVNAQIEKWIPYIPRASQVKFESWKENGTSYIRVLIWFRTTGYKVTDWGTHIVDGNSIYVDAEIWDWKGLDGQMEIIKSHTYYLRNLSTPDYYFVFKAWGCPVKDTTITIPEFPSFLILSLFMIATLLAAIVYRRKHAI